MKNAPAWVQTFNDRKAPDLYAGRTWAALGSPSLALCTLPPTAGAPLYDAVYGSPFGNDELVGFALGYCRASNSGNGTRLTCYP